METGIVGTFSRLSRRQFIYSSSSELEFTGAVPEHTRERLAFQFGVRLAHRIVVQTRTQRDLVRSTFDRDATIIPNFCETAPLEKRQPEAFLWIGRIVWYKDPLAYVALAEQTPEAQFWMLAPEPRQPSELQAAVWEAATRLPNLELRPSARRVELLSSSAEYCCAAG